jgi:hypothetical protein
MIVYKLKKDWSSFKAGDKFTASSYGNLYQLVNDDNKFVLAKIQPDLLTVVGSSHTWRPSEVGSYHYIDSDGIVLNEEYYIEDDHTDKGRLAIGNCFKTAKEANNMRDWLKARQNLINSGARFINTIDVVFSQSYYNVYYAIDRGNLVIEDAYVGENTVGDKRLYFNDRQLADRSIKDHRDDWLTYLGVKEKSDED